MKTLLTKFTLFDWLVLFATVVFFILALFVFKKYFSAWGFALAFCGVGWTLRTIFNSPTI